MVGKVRALTLSVTAIGALKLKRKKMVKLGKHGQLMSPYNSNSPKLATACIAEIFAPKLMRQT